MSRRSAVRLLRLQNFPIFRQLQLEERLLRGTRDNWCLINDGTTPPAIVMGISGKADQLLYVEKVVEDHVPVVRRFSGGGTVIVDQDTIFMTLICHRSVVPNLELYPRPIMAWTEQLYLPVFQDVPGFRLQEHDYVFNSRKFGGNAQSIIKDRWLHHTSFLWDYEDSRMALLRFPKRVPGYRQTRSHADFICRLRDFLPTREHFLEGIQEGLEHHFDVREESIEEVEQEISSFQHRFSTRVVPPDEVLAMSSETT